MLTRSYFQVAKKSSFFKRRASTSPYLRESILPTFIFQDALPKLQVPKLEDTLDKYFGAVEAMEGHPTICRSKIADTKKIVNQFIQKVGPALQQELIKRAQENPDSCYAKKMWDDYYLKDRNSLAFANPHLHLLPDKNKKMNNQLVRSTNIIVSSMKYWKSIQDQVLRPDVYYLKDTAKSIEFEKNLLEMPSEQRYMQMVMNRAFPRDMSSLGCLFSTARIPQEGRDVVQTFEGATHMVVMRNGHFYKFDVIDENQSVIPAENIARNLNYILNDESPRPQHLVSYLPSNDRESWAKARQHLLATGNETQVRDIDSALLFLVLADDDEAPEGGGSTGSKGLLHNSGDSMWYDKSVTLLVTSNGEFGTQFEHSWGDALNAFFFYEAIFNDSTQNPAIYPEDLPMISLDSSNNVERLHFDLDEISQANIDEAEKKFMKLVKNYNVYKWSTTKMCRSYLKDKNVSCDGFMQLLWQIAYRRLFGHSTGHFEPVTMSAYSKSRIEMMNTVTKESREAVNMIADSAINKGPNVLSQMKDQVMKSCKRHNKLVKDSLLKQGYFQHLATLQSVAKDSGIEADFFKDPTWDVMTRFTVDTSNSEHDMTLFGSRSPSVEDGFSIMYGANINTIGGIISTLGNTDLEGFVSCLTESADFLHALLETY